MKIKRISAYGLYLPLAEVQYLSKGRRFEGFDSTFIRIDTDEGITGWGEICPWGNNYLPAFSGAIRAALEVLGPQLIGRDPRRPEVLTRQMDAILPGHLYTKAGIDYAIWDVIGKAAGMPIYELLGGKEDHAVATSASLHLDSTDAMLGKLDYWRKRGVSRFSIKMGRSLADDIEAVRAFSEVRRDDELFIFDANGGWSPWEATRVINATSDLDVTFEQPCATYDECVDVRGRTQRPFCLDECMVEYRDFMRAISDKSCEIVNVKLARVGGITRARWIRDLCMANNIHMLIMCMAGTVVNDTIVAHFAQSLPANRLVGTWSCQDYITVDAAPGRGARHVDGHMTPPDLPGLGVEPDLALLGDPLFVFE